MQWICDWPEAKSQTFSLYQGETATFEPTFRVNGRTVTNATIEAVWYQTNGMANAWWKLDGATFAPSNDVGAASYRFFVEAKASGDTIYRANGALRMLPSPGFTPNAIEPPVQTLDFDLIDVLHAPWATPDDLDTKADSDDLLDYVPLDGDSTITGDITINGEVSIIGTGGLGVEGGLSVYSGSAALYGGIAIGPAGDQRIDGNLAGDKIIFEGHGEDGTNRSELQPDGSDVMTYDRVAAAISTLSDSIPDTTSNIVTKAYVEDLGISSEESDPTVPAWAKAATKPTYTAAEVGAVPTSRTVNGKALSANISLTASDVGAATTSELQNLSSQVTAISGHLNAEDARFVSTNYNSHVHLPEASVEVSVSNEWLTVWREMTRWDAFVGSGFDWTSWGGFLSWMSTTESALDQKADRAWGYYDSHTGGWAPESYTQVSSSNILIAAGMGYQRTVSSGHTYWVLTANEPYEVSGISSNGFFRVADADGNVQFEIIKGDKRTVPAPPDGVSASGGVLTVSYPVASQPTVEVSLTLADGGTWYAEDSASCPAIVAWSGTSGAYVATVTPSAPTAQLFVKASYQVGGATYINNRAPISITGGIYFNGTLYMPTVNGNKLEFVAQ